MFETAQVNSRSIVRVSGSTRTQVVDSLSIEEPLEIRLAPTGGEPRSVSVTMRTPGHDSELAAGFLFTEGLLSSPSQITNISPCGSSGNVVKVMLAPGVEPDLDRLKRNFYTTSSCGVCGKSSIDAIRVARSPIPEGAFTLSSRTISGLPEELRRSQGIFAATGGLHASGLFNSDGKLLCVREDVGRHNALDKVIGQSFLEGELPLSRAALVVSGRASFELVQKAAMAGLPCLIAVGAPSSLAVDLAQDSGITLIGFARDGRFNVYCGEQRVLP